MRQYDCVLPLNKNLIILRVINFFETLLLPCARIAGTYKDNPANTQIGAGARAGFAQASPVCRSMPLRDLLGTLVGVSQAQSGPGMDMPVMPRVVISIADLRNEGSAMQTTRVVAHTNYAQSLGRIWKGNHFHGVYWAWSIWPWYELTMGMPVRDWGRVALVRTCPAVPMVARGIWNWYQSVFLQNPQCYAVCNVNASICRHRTHHGLVTTSNPWAAHGLDRPE